LKEIKKDNIVAMGACRTGKSAHGGGRCSGGNKIGQR
jgi:hypothetical protein